MASTSLAQQLQKLGTPQTKLFALKNKKLSLLFDSSEAASIDRVSIYEIGVNGLNELIQLNHVFEEFRNSLFDETSKNFERTVESSEVNEALDRIIRRFLCFLSPYFILRPSQKVLEWLIARFHIHDYNTDELICAALPYHGTRTFSRLLQVLDLQNEKSKWHWLYPLQRKGVFLSKQALFDHCASDAPFLKMISEFTVDCVQVFGDAASKLTTLFGFFSTTVIGVMQNLSDITELHLTYVLPALLDGLSSNCVDYTASTFLIIASILTRSAFQERLHKIFVEKISKVEHVALRRSIVLALNILHQFRDLKTSTVPKEALRTLQRNSDWFIPTFADFLSSNTFPNVFYFTLVRDALRQAKSTYERSEEMITFVSALLGACRIDETSAEILIRIVVEECCESDASWSCDLVQRLERQFPTVWDSVVVNLLKTHPSGSLTRVFGLTSVSSQVQIFEKLNHVESSIRVEAIKWIAGNADIVKIEFIENSLISQWDDDNPAVIEAMFSLPDQLRYYTPNVCEKLLLRYCRESSAAWNNVLLHIIASLETEQVTKTSSTKYTIMLLPFLVHSNNLLRKSILEVNIPFLNGIRRNLKTNMNEAIHKTLKNKSVLPKVEELISLYDVLPWEKAHVFTLLLLLSASYKFCNCDSKLKVLAFIFEQIFPAYFRKFKWKESIVWDQNQLTEYYEKTNREIPREIVHHLLTRILENTSVSRKLLSPGWCDFMDQQTMLVCSLYEYLSESFQSSSEAECISFVSLFSDKHLTVLPERVNFLCNLCVSHKRNEFLQINSFKMINSSFKNAAESFSWALKITTSNTIVPTILIFAYSTNPQLRRVVMESINILCASLGPAIADEVTYIELLKHIAKHEEEIIVDREQLPAVLYGFLSQDRAVQDLLPTSVRFLTKRIFNALFDCITSESVPLMISASLLPTFEVFKDSFTLHRLISLAKRILDCNNDLTKDGSVIVRNVIDKLNVNAMDIFDQNEPQDFLHFCMDNCSTIRLRTEDDTVVCLGSILLRKLCAIFDAFNEPNKRYILNSTLKILVGCEFIDLTLAANSFMKKIILDAELIVPYLENLKIIDLEKMMMLSTKPKQIEWRMAVALLEIAQNKKKIRNCQTILPLLFDVLQKCCEVDERITMEYAKQLCLSCILTCCQKLTSEMDSNGDLCSTKMRKNVENLFNVELIVNCIRMSPNSQTHHHALMLLGYCASFAPDQVLHNVMAIFTFMGSSVLRQDDAFSFQIISNILDTIVPLLVQNEHKSLSLYNVLKVFAVSIPDIPDHRRVPLLVRLMKILNDGEHLHVLVIFALESASKNHASSMDPKFTETLLEVLLAMPLKQTLDCLNKVMFCANSLPHDTGDFIDIPQDDSLLDMRTFKNKELHHFKYLLMNFISNFLSNSEFIQKVSVFNSNEVNDVEVYFRGIIEQTIIYIKAVSEYCAKGKSTSVKYWKVMSSQAVDVLNKANALLSSRAFLKIAEKLIVHVCPIVQRKTLELLNWRLQQCKDETQPDQLKIDDLVNIIPILMKVISGILKDMSDDCNDVKLNQQTALISMKLLVKYFYSSKYTAKFKKTLMKLSGLLSKNPTINHHVLACLVLAIAELTSALKVHAIEALPKFVPEFLHIFKRYHTKEFSPNDVLLLSVAVAIQKLTETLPNFLSPYLKSMLFEVTCVSARALRMESLRALTNDDSRNSSVVHKMKIIVQKLAEIPPRVLLPSISACFERVCETRNFDALKPLMNILAENFPRNGHFTPELTSFFFMALDFRCMCGVDIDEEEVLLVESTIIEGLAQIVLKCSETTFRPFYHKLYDWGIIMSKEPSKKDRIITYYRILCIISEKLKGIFVLFASNFVRNAAELLQTNKGQSDDEEASQSSFSEKKKISLVDSILKTLFNVFKYDTMKFLTKDRFDMLCEPLVNQIENTMGDYTTRSQEVIIPCLARFAAATTDDSLLKQFNYLILLKTRHACSEVRLAALDTVVTLATYLGDNFLAFLPETIPFLGELLEDENEIVEKQTHKAILKLEEVLQEPIQKYF